MEPSRERTQARVVVFPGIKREVRAVIEMG
jgi:hypothetical protein